MSRPCLAGVRVGAERCQSSRLTSHVCKLLAAALEIIAVLGLDGVLDGARHGVVGAEDGALHQLDLAGHAALETAGGSDCSAGLLALSPGRDGAGLAPRVGRGCPLGRAKVGGGIVVAARGRVDIGAVVGLSGVLRGRVADIGLGQAVGRVRAVVGLAVEGIGVGAGGVVVQERAGDLVLVLPAAVVL